jgi:hypothetical protein
MALFVALFLRLVPRRKRKPPESQNLIPNSGLSRSPRFARWPKKWHYLALLGAWFKNACFRVTTGVSARTLVVPTLEWVFAAISFTSRATALVSRKPSVAQKFQPMGARLPGQ